MLDSGTALEVEKGTLVPFLQVLVERSQLLGKHVVVSLQVANTTACFPELLTELCLHLPSFIMKLCKLACLTLDCCPVPVVEGVIGVSFEFHDLRF